MSGHSKWHNIQAKKGKADAARGAVFTKIGREIAIAVRDGGANPESNGKLRDIIAKNGGNLGTTGSVSFMFDEKGVLVVERTPGSDEEEMMMMALDAGAEDMKVDDDAYEIYTEPNDFSTVREALEKQGVTFLTAEVDKIPQNTVALPDEETIQKIQKLLEMLEDNDDVQNVWHNAELPEEEDDED